MTKLVVPALLALLAAAPRGHAAATPGEKLSPAIVDSLTRISNTLFEAQSYDFIVVEALRDGYLEFDKAYTLALNTDSAMVVANGKLLPADISRRYQQRLREFRFYNGNVPRTKLSITQSGDGFNLNTILDPASSYRKSHVAGSADAEREHAKKNIGRVIRELVRDGIITDEVNYTIDYTSTGLQVNGKALPTALDEKYRTFFRVFMDVEPKDDKGSYRYSMSSK